MELNMNCRGSIWWLAGPLSKAFAYESSFYTATKITVHSAHSSGHRCVLQRTHSAINGQIETAWLAMVPDPSEMSRTSVVRSILDISDGSDKGQPRAVKSVSADCAPRPISSAKASVRECNMHLCFPNNLDL